MSRVKNWIELLTLVGVFIGLGLVIMQLRQNEELIRFQIATEIRVNQDNNRSVIRGEQLSKTLAKAHTMPEEMTDAELLEFDAHARSILSELHFRRVLSTVGIFKGDWRTWLLPETCVALDNSIGRTWLKVQQQTAGLMLDEEMLGELDRRLAECASRPSLLESLRDGQDQ